jgi:hypothetical protein
MSEAVQQRTMTEGRALLTEREKEALAGDGSDSYRYKTRTYFRSRLEKLERDVEMLAEHDPELLDELRDVVCADAEGGREPVETPIGGQADRTDPPTTSPATRAQDAGEIDATDAAGPDPIGDALDGWEPEADANPRTARAQTRAAAEWLRSEGEYRRAGEFRDALASDSTLAERTWWDRHVRPGLNHLADAGLVEYTKNRGYRWVGEGEV